MRTPRIIFASLLTCSLLVPAASTAATSAQDAVRSAAAPHYAGVWTAKSLPQARPDHGATFRFRVNENNRVVWVNGHYAINNRPSCWEKGWSFSLLRLSAPIDAEHTFKVRGRGGVNHVFVISGTMLSETRAKGRLRILKVPNPSSGWGCGGDYRFAWRGHKL